MQGMIGKASILIVDDEAIYLLDLIRNFEERGYQVIWSASTGEKAVETTRIENPAFILMDIRLCGEIDGVQAARKIRGFSQAPIIFMTGYPLEYVEADIQSIQKSIVLHKPIDMNTLERVMQQLQGEETR